MTRVVNVAEDSYNVPFSLRDEKACKDCKPGYKDGCDQVVLKVVPQSVVNVVQMERFLDAFHDKIKGKRCDFMIYDEIKVALGDLTCSSGKYLETHQRAEKDVPGKREMAYAQIEETIRTLCHVDIIHKALMEKKKKVALFAYRVKDYKSDNAFTNRVTQPMREFNRLESALSGSEFSSDMIEGFSFVKVAYPKVYVW